MSLVPKTPADSAAAAASHLWHLTYQLGGLPGGTRVSRIDRWRDVAVELTILAEQLRAQAVGRRARPYDDGRQAHVAALRGKILEILEGYESEVASAAENNLDARRAMVSGCP